MATKKRNNRDATSNKNILDDAHVNFSSTPHNNQVFRGCETPVREALDLELNSHKKRKYFVDNHHSKNNNNIKPADTLNTHLDVDSNDLLGFEVEVIFLRAVAWMKMHIQNNKEVLVKEVRNALEKMEAIMMAKKTQQQSQKAVDLISKFIPESPQRDWGVNNPSKSHNQIPELVTISDSDDDNADDEANHYPSSPEMSFGEDDVLPRQQPVANSTLCDDSGIFFDESIRTTSNATDTTTLVLTEKQSNQKCFKVPEAIMRRLPRPLPTSLDVEKQTISPTHLSYIFEQHQIDSFSLGMTRIILQALESKKVIKHCRKKSLMITEAIKIIVEFMNIMINIDQTKTSSILYFYQSAIINMIFKIFDNNFMKTDITELEKSCHIQTILELCNCEKICEETIDFFIDKLEKIFNQNDSSQLSDNHGDLDNDNDKKIVIYGLEIVIKKYCSIIMSHECENNRTGNLYPKSNEIWRQQWVSNHSPINKYQTYELQLQNWIAKLTELLNKFSDFPFHLEYLEWIQKFIFMLSNCCEKYIRI